MVIKSIAHVKANDRLSIFVTDGIVKAKVEDTYKEDYDERAITGSNI